MSRPIEELKNFGPYMVKIMNEIGFFTEEDLLNSDYKSIQQLLIAKNITPNLLIFYSIEMGLQDRKWDAITPIEKAEIQNLLKEG